MTQQVMDQIKANGGRVTPAVLGTIKEMLAMVTQKIKPAVTDEHEKDATMLANAAAALAKCDAAMAKGTAAAAPPLQSSKEHATKHHECRAAQAELNGAERACKATLPGLAATRDKKCAERDAAEDDSSSLAPCEVSCNYAESTPEKCWAAVLGKVESLDGFYAERSKAYLRLTEECAGATAGHTDKVAECTGLKAAHAGKKADCDEAQFEAEVSFCIHHAEMATTCEGHAACRKTGHETLGALVGATIEKEADRKAERTAVSKVECILEAWEKSTGEVDLDAVKACDEAKVSLEHQTMSYPTPPTGPPCKVPVFPDFAGKYASAPWAVVAPAAPVDARVTPPPERASTDDLP